MPNYLVIEITRQQLSEQSPSSQTNNMLSTWTAWRKLPGRGSAAWLSRTLLCVKSLWKLGCRTKLLRLVGTWQAQGKETMLSG